jgi:hypothetical protein
MSSSPGVPSPVSRLPSSEPWLQTPVLFLHLAALALALGAPVFFALAVAPAVFRILPTRDMAASLQSPILTSACRLAEGSFAVLFLTSWLLGRWWEAAKLTRTLATRAAILGMITAVVIESLLIPPMDRIRAEAPGLIDSLPANDPSRVLLARYHLLATGFFSAGIVAAFVILVSTVRLMATRRKAPPPPPSSPAVPKLLDLSNV